MQMLDFKEPLLSVFHVLKKSSWSKLTSCYGNVAVVVAFNNEKWSNFVHLLKLLKHQLLYMLWLSVNTICTQSVTPRSPNQHRSGCAEHLWAWSQRSLDTTLTDRSKQCHPAWQLPYMSQNPSIVKSKPIRVHSQYLGDMTEEKHARSLVLYRSQVYSPAIHCQVQCTNTYFFRLTVVYRTYVSSNFLRTLRANVKICLMVQ